MKADAGVERTREVRTRISREHGNDMRRLVEYYIEYQRQFSSRLRWAPGGHQEPAEPAEPAAAADGAERRG
jgi:hypothetical protein